MNPEREGAFRPWEAPQAGPYPGGPGGQPHAPPPPPPPQEPTPDERNWALFAHLAAFAGVVFPVIGNLVGPLLVWVLKKDSSPYVDHHGKEALNFQIFVSIVLVALLFLFFMGVALSILLIGIPILIMAGVAMVVVTIVAFILVIVASVEANKGTWYRYPFSYRFIR